MKKIRAITTFLINQYTSDEGFKHIYQEFNDKGHTTVEERYFAEDELEQKILRSYDDQDRLIEEITYSDQHEPDQHIVYHYEAGAKPHKVEVIYANGAKTTYIHTYNDAERSENVVVMDENGTIESNEYRRWDAEERLLEEEIKDVDGNIVSRVVNEFDQHGNPLKVYIHSEDGDEFTHTFEYETDEKGYIVELKVSDDRGKVFRQETFEYDEQGNRTERRFEDRQRGRAGIEVWEYDDQGREILHQVLKPNGNPQEEVAITYGENGLVAEREYRDSDGVVIHMYEYITTEM